jgi:glyoxylase-like metal-dependent hydrolase (beta-lactamase superfamily II)
MSLTFPTQIFPVYFSQFVVPGEAMVVSSHKDWRKIYPAAGNGFSKWALRSLVVVKGDSVVLIDTGFGNKQDDSFFEPFWLEGNYNPDGQLKEIGLSRNDITDVVLTHLHYDHCGGCLFKENDKIVAAYPKAKLWISSVQWKNALNPLTEEKDSFLDENIKPLPGFYPVQFVEEGGYLPGIYFKIANGHTRGQIIPLIKLDQGHLLFGADLFPSSSHLDPDVNMAYDMDQALAKKEKQQVMEECIRNDYTIFFQHGLNMEACKVSRKEAEILVHPVNIV